MGKPSERTQKWLYWHLKKFCTPSYKTQIKMATIKKSMLTALQTHIKRFYSGTVGIALNQEKNQVVFSIKHFGKSLEKGLESPAIDFKNLPNSDNILQKTILELDRLSSEISLKLLHKQFDMIASAYQLIRGSHWKEINIPLELSKSVDPKWLEETCTQLFINRLGENCRAARKLTGSEIDSFMDSELSIGIILRSCILDCLSIAKWLLEPEYIHWLAYESFKKLPPVVSPRVRNEFDRIAKYLNPNEHDFRHDKLLKRAINTDGADSLYMYYSKYDHFSLVPSFQRKTTGNRLSMAVEALAYIRQSIFSLINFGFDIPTTKYSELLGVSAIYDEVNRSYHLSLTPLHDLITD